MTLNGIDVASVVSVGTVVLVLGFVGNNNGLSLRRVVDKETLFCSFVVPGIGPKHKTSASSTLSQSHAALVTCCARPADHKKTSIMSSVAAAIASVMVNI